MQDEVGGESEVEVEAEGFMGGVGGEADIRSISGLI